jgi:predicted nucleotidyltransferase
MELDPSNQLEFEEIKDALFSEMYKELDAKDFKELFKHGFVFGSAVFGDKKTAKDYDIAVYFESRSFIQDLLDEKKIIYTNGYNSDDYFGCFYGKCRGVVVNILDFYTKERFEKYMKATEIMTYLYKHDGFKSRMNDKRFRVRLFEFFVDEL